MLSHCPGSDATLVGDDRLANAFKRARQKSDLRTVQPPRRPIHTSVKIRLVSVRYFNAFERESMEVTSCIPKTLSPVPEVPWVLSHS